MQTRTSRKSQMLMTNEIQTPTHTHKLTHVNRDKHAQRHQNTFPKLTNGTHTDKKHTFHTPCRTRMVLPLWSHTVPGAIFRTSLALHLCRVSHTIYFSARPSTGVRSPHVKRPRLEYDSSILFSRGRRCCEPRSSIVISCSTHQPRPADVDASCHLC